MNNIYFISGLPRSGSTLLANILAQNPRFHVSPTSGLVELIRATRDTWKSIPLLRSLDEELYFQRHNNTLRGVIQSFYFDVEEVVFDKNRSWPHYIEMLEECLGEIKIIAPVREPTEIISSFELLWRRDNSAPTDADMTTVEKRAEYFTSASAPLGSAYNLLKDAIMRGHGDKILFVPYEDFIPETGEWLDRIYDFIGEEPFNHSLEEIETVIHEDDRLHGYRDLHKIKPRLEYIEERSWEVLGVPLTEKYLGQDFWEGFDV